MFNIFKNFNRKKNLVSRKANQLLNCFKNNQTLKLEHDRVEFTLKDGRVYVTHPVATDHFQHLLFKEAEHLVSNSLDNLTEEPKSSVSDRDSFNILLEEG